MLPTLLKIPAKKQVNPNTLCRVTGKRKYKSVKAADRIASKALLSPSFVGENIRCYFCYDCGYYHLTSESFDATKVGRELWPDQKTVMAIRNKPSKKRAKHGFTRNADGKAPENQVLQHLGHPVDVNRQG